VCATTIIDSRHYHVVFEGSPFAPGATATVNVTFGYELAPQSGPLRQTWTYTWSFPGAYGLRSTTASGRDKVTICSPAGPTCSTPLS
jgi:hypothetical protein